MLSVIGFLFFLITLADSFYCGLSPKKKTYGVQRLNTRLAFYAYERRKMVIVELENTKLKSTKINSRVTNIPTESVNIIITFKSN